MSAKWLVKLVRGPVVAFLKAKLADQAFVTELADMANAKVDIPNISEETEAMLFRAYLIATATALLEYLEKL